MSVLRRWLCFGDGRGSWFDVLRWFCGSGFVGLSSWVWVCEFGFMGLGLWIINVTGVDRQVDQCGSLTWLVSLAWVIDLIGVGLISVSLIVVVVVGIVVASGRWWVWLLGWDSETVRERERQWNQRERMNKIKTKRGIKNYKEIIFKWSCKKNRSFDVWYVVKWGVTIVKVVFWNYKC